VSPLLKSKKEVLDTADPQQVLIPGVDLSVLDSDIVAKVPSTRWLNRDEVKTKYHSQSTPLPMLQLTLQPTPRLMLQQTLRPMLLVMPLTT
jgi:hypothetical protein